LSLYCSTFCAVMVNSGFSLPNGSDRKPLLSTLPAFFGSGSQADRAVGVAGLFRAHRGQAAPSLAASSADTAHDAGRQQGQAQYTGLQQTSGLFMSCRPGSMCLEVHAEAEGDEVAVIHGGVLAVEEVGVRQARRVGVLVFGVQAQADRLAAFLEVAARAWRVAFTSCDQATFGLRFTPANTSL
jgi:hypothetical protein